MEYLSPISSFWHFLAATVSVLFAAAASAHAVLYKRDSRAALLWVAVIWLVPIVGGVLYLALGINRIKRRALFLRGGMRRQASARSTGAFDSELAAGRVVPACPKLPGLPKVVGTVVFKPLLFGNRVNPLVNGDEAFPAMAEAIESARESIALATYIFDNDSVGKRVAAALIAAAKRGVEVRVLVDDTGARYSFPPIMHVLRKGGTSCLLTCAITAKFW
jgi:cardiolipin synthase A/B